MADPSVLMIGWEYPPHNSGGLGVACEGLTQALSNQNTQVYFTLPYHHPQNVSHLRFIDCYDPAWDLAGQQSPFMAYASTNVASKLATGKLDVDGLQALPSSQLEQRVHEYAQLVAEEAEKLKKDFSVIHAHDWMTFKAGMQVKRETGKPLIAQVHSTEFDRIPTGSGSPYIHQTEYEGLQAADRIIAVSNYTKKILIDKYAVDPAKIVVVHNGAPALATLPTQAAPSFASHRPVVVFMGRLTLQKGTEYFLSLARQVLAQIPQALFIVAGNGDMYQQLLISTAAQGLSASVLFSGFLRGQLREELLDRADVFVMPSLSEPFGLVAVEAAQRQTPVIISKTSGVSEVLPHAISVDFWDVDKMAETLLGLLANPKQRQKVITGQAKDLQTVTWDRSAQLVRNVYRQAFVPTARPSSSALFPPK